MIKTITPSIIINFSIIYFIGIILVAHYFAPSIYQWTTNTISDLAAQNYSNAWIMRLGFIGFGILLNIGILFKYYQTKTINLPDILIMLYGIAVLCSGIFSVRPFDGSVNYLVSDDKLHSFFAQIAGFALSAGVLLYIVISQESMKLVHFLFLALIMGLSASFGLSKNGTLAIDFGIIQRCLYGVSFVWLLLVYNVLNK